MKSVLVIGMSMLGRYLAMRMQDMGNDVMIIDKDESIIQELSPHFPDSLVGDCCNEEVLRAIGVNNFDICFVAIGDDSYASLEITSMLKELGAQHVVAKAKRQRQADFLLRIGADEVCYPEKEIAEKLAVRYNATNIFDCIELTGDYSILEIPVVPAWVNRTIAEVNVRKSYNVNIIAVKSGGVINPDPGGGYVFAASDHLMVLGRTSDLFRISSMTL